MKSDTANAVRRRRIEREAAMSPEERVRLALSLGKRECMMYAAAHGLAFTEAREVLRRSKSARCSTS